MAKRQMSGDNRERRAKAKDARDAGSRASEQGASTSAEKQRTEAKPGMSHQQRLDLKREGKHDVIEPNTPTARPGSRDPDTPDRETFPRR